MRRLIACVLLPSSLTACMQWKVQEATPQQVVAQEQLLDMVHVTLSDGSWVVLEQPEISGGSLIGVVTEGEYRGQPLKQGLRTSIDLADVVQVAVQKRTLEATAWPLVGAIAVVGAVGYVEFLAWAKN
ncbi:MAG: hypothetical protein GTO22_03005 [Gemmatimonadales bacterium]|nr:hypothetical protein [Gemmatimonadales bacterium]